MIGVRTWTYEFGGHNSAYKSEELNSTFLTYVVLEGMLGRCLAQWRHLSCINVTYPDVHSAARGMSTENLAPRGAEPNAGFLWASYGGERWSGEGLVLTVTQEMAPPPSWGQGEARCASLGSSLHADRNLRGEA